MVWRFHTSIFLMVMEMKDMVGFDLGEDSCGLSKAAHRDLFRAACASNVWCLQIQQL